MTLLRLYAAETCSFETLPARGEVLSIILLVLTEIRVREESKALFQRSLRYSRGWAFDDMIALDVESPNNGI